MSEGYFFVQNHGIIGTDETILLMKMLMKSENPDISMVLEDSETNVYNPLEDIGKPLESLIFQGFFVF